MATNHSSSGRHRRKVVLKADKVKKELASASDGAEMSESGGVEASDHTEVVNSTVHYEDPSSLEVAPLINKAKSDTNIIDIRREESSPVSLRSSQSRGKSEDCLLNTPKTKSPSLSFTSEEKQEEREEEKDEGESREEEKEEGQQKNENVEEEQEGESGEESEVGISHSHSDDVFLLTRTPPQSSLLLNSDQTEVKVAHSRSDESGLRHPGNDLLPPLPASRRGRRRPYTSPARNSSSCSTDSYTSPICDNTVVSSATTDGIRRESFTKRKQRKVSRNGRNNRIHPEDRPPDLKFTSPLHSSLPLTATISDTASRAAERRTLSSTDSLSSTLLTPLLTSSLRKGGVGSRSGSSSLWQFDAEAQLESCFPDRHLHVLVVTWNMQELEVKTFYSMVYMNMYMLALSPGHSKSFYLNICNTIFENWVYRAWGQG